MFDKMFFEMEVVIPIQIDLKWIEVKILQFYDILFCETAKSFSITQFYLVS